MKTILSFFILFILANTVISQTTAIPDANFEQALINLGYDTGIPDGVVLTANIDTVTSLPLTFLNISDLTGIEDFIALDSLMCNNNMLTSLNVTQNINLTFLNCWDNQLSSLDITQNTALVNLDCQFNQLTSLDITQNIALIILNCRFNQLTNLDVTQNTSLILVMTDGNLLTSIDVTQNTALSYFFCSYNSLTSLDVTQTTNLVSLDCSNNQLTSLYIQNIAIQELVCDFNNLTTLDVTQDTALTGLRCSNNQISNLDVTQNTSLLVLECGSNNLSTLDITLNTNLYILNCSYNQLTSLDVSQNSLLSQFFGQYNQLTTLDLTQNYGLTDFFVQNNLLACLNIKNGFNGNLYNFEATNNPNLTCIEVDDDVFSTAYWTNIDAGAYYDTSCTPCLIPCILTPDFNVVDNGNGNYTFTNTSTGTFNQTHWAFGDGNTSTATSPNHTFSANGTFVVVLTINDSTAGGSCMDYYLDTIVVTGVVSPLQCAAGFVMYPDTVINNFVLVNSSSGTNLTYLWDFGDGDTSTLQFPTHVYATSGPFYLCLTVDDGAGCNDMYCDSVGQNGVVFKQSGFTINVIAPPIITEINTPMAKGNIKIFPNPTSSQLTIESGGLIINKINITGITGRMVKTIVPKTNVINVADLPCGIFFIQLITKDETITQKFVKN